MQLSGGMVQTGMRNLDSWGLYMANTLFFVGLSAGGLIISSVPNAFGMKGFGGISKVAIWTSVCCTCAAIGFVVVDLGGPARLWELFVYSNFSSPLMWDILVLGTYLILSVIYLWAYLRAEAGRMSHTAEYRAISVVALIVAILVHNVTAWIFSLAPAHEFWHTALMGPWFVASALDCGTALVLIVCLALRRAGYLALDQKHVANLAKMLAVFVLVDLYFYACDLLTSGYFGGEGTEIVAMLTSGALAPVFWTQVALMAVSVVILVVPKLRTTPSSVASVLAILGVFCDAADSRGRLPDSEPGYARRYHAVCHYQLAGRVYRRLSGHGLCSAADRIRRHARRARHVRSVLAAGPEVPALEALRERRLAPLFSSSRTRLLPNLSRPAPFSMKGSPW